MLIMLLIAAGACRKEDEPRKAEHVYVLPPKKEVSREPLRVSAVPINGFSTLKRLEDDLGSDKMLLVLKLNRIDRKHVRDDDTLVVPSTFDDRLTPFPYSIEKSKEITKLIIISRSAQVFGAYEAGRLVRWGPTSTGKRVTPTSEGLYHANWKKKLAVSTVDSTWLLPWCINIHNTQGISLHQFDLPGYPASHSCIRLLEEDAKWLYEWVGTWKLTPDASEILAHGTPVVVFDKYAYGSPFLRRRILKDPTVHFVSRASLDSIVTVYLPTIMERQERRQKLLSADTVLENIRM